MDHFFAHPPLTLAAVYPYLRARLETLLPLQIDAPGSPEHGGLFSPDYINAPWSIAKALDMLKRIWFPMISDTW